MFALACAVAALVSQDPAPPAPALDAAQLAQAKAHYEAFVFRWFEGRWPDGQARQQLPVSAQKPSVAASPAVAPCPVDPARGVYANRPDKLKTASWLGVGLAQCPDADRSASVLGALHELSYHFENGFNSDTLPQECVPGACFFAIRAEYAEPGFWVALRDVPGADGATHTVVAGVWQMRKVPDEPSRDKGMKAWLAAVDAKFAATPAPATPAKEP